MSNKNGDFVSPNELRSMRQAISRRIDRALNFSALWIGGIGIEGSPLRKQSRALGGFQESTQGRLCCHPKFFATQSFRCDDENACSGSHHRPKMKDGRPITQHSVRPRRLRSRPCSLRRLIAARRNDDSCCAVSLSHRGTGTSAGDGDHASRFASRAFAEIQWSASDTHTSDSTGWMRLKAAGLSLQVRTQQQQALPLNPAAHGTRRCSVYDDDWNSRQSGDSSCSLSEEYADTIAAQTLHPGCEPESSPCCRRSCRPLEPETSRIRLRLTPDVDPKWGHPSDIEPDTSPPVPADSSRSVAVRCTPPTFALPSASANHQTPLWTADYSIHRLAAACHSDEVASGRR